MNLYDLLVYFFSIDEDNPEIKKAKENKKKQKKIKKSKRIRNKLIA
jgi:hypothetical protein